MSGFMMGLSVYLLIGLVIGILIVNQKEYNEALEQTLNESPTPDVIQKLMRNKQIVLIAMMWFGLPILAYLLFTKEGK